MKRYMLDTDMCSFIIKEHPQRVRQRFQTLAMEQLCVSVVTYAELIYGVERSSSRRVNRPVIEDFVRHLDVMDWDAGAADQYGVIRTELEAAGTLIGAMDMMIAAHAKSIKAVLVTNNQKHFTKVKGLKIDNWT
ncbi:MAG TPA: type II toxin-antitoxin system VapC family toxin [Halieaceae bacterium]|nr:MAG: VapC toxin family PIN domain ribonuclease [Gammaproteobacteria bacterium]HDY82595.1 type II toxin-antitoxin system VapC family toxin [Halieaceae bacterium]